MKTAHLKTTIDLDQNWNVINGKLDKQYMTYTIKYINENCEVKYIIFIYDRI